MQSDMPYTERKQPTNNYNSISMQLQYPGLGIILSCVPVLFLRLPPIIMNAISRT